MSTRTAVSALSWGEVLWDLFPSGACLGGAPSNLAVHLVANGLPTALVTRVGNDDLGQEAVAELGERGVETGAVQHDETLATGKVGVELRDGEAHYTLHPGAWQRIACDARAVELLRTCRAFCFGTLSQERAMGLESWREALAHLPGDAIRFCDPNLRGGRIDPELVLEHMRAATIVKLNDAEERVFAATYGCSDVARWLIEEMGVELVAITLGPAGTRLISETETRAHAGFTAGSGGDNVGAGDAFGAVLVRGALAGASLPAIAEAANRYGSFVASQRGATPRPSEQLRAQVAAILGLSN